MLRSQKEELYNIHVDCQITHTRFYDGLVLLSSLPPKLSLCIIAKFRRLGWIRGEDPMQTEGIFQTYQS